MGFNSFNPFKRTEQPGHIAGDVEHEPLKVPGEHKAGQDESIDPVQRVSANVEQEKHAALERAAQEFGMSVEDFNSFRREKTAGEKGAETLAISGSANGISMRVAKTMLPAIRENQGKEMTAWDAEVGGQPIEDPRKAANLYDHLNKLLTRRDYLIEGKTKDRLEESLLSTAVGEDTAEKIRDVLGVKS